MVPIDSEKLGTSSVEAWALERLQADGLADPLRSVLTELVGLLENERLREHEVFLTVIVRTQAKRWEQLQDSLLCLAAQTDQDFEVLLMLHEVSLEDESRVRGLIAAFPEAFASRVRLQTVQGGGRTRPLAVAIDSVRGQYVAFFDDDDLLMADWVEVFHEGARLTPGQVIRANVAVQNNSPERWTNGVFGQRSVSAAVPAYAAHFNLVDHLERNRTPFMAFAFPSAFFTLWGEGFDEELPVLEDWDVALRATGLLGVNSRPELTAIYRHWVDASTSYTSHDQEEWDAAARAVRSRLSEAPLLMPMGTITDTIDVLARESRVHEEIAAVLRSPFWRLSAPLRWAVNRLRGIRSKIRR